MTTNSKDPDEYDYATKSPVLPTTNSKDPEEYVDTTKSSVLPNVTSGDPKTKVKPTTSEETNAHPSKPTRKSIDPEASEAIKNTKHNFYYDPSPTTPTTTNHHKKKIPKHKNKTKPSSISSPDPPEDVIPPKTPTPKIKRTSLCHKPSTSENHSLNHPDSKTEDAKSDNSMIT